MSANYAPKPQFKQYEDLIGVERDARSPGQHLRRTCHIGHYWGFRSRRAGEWRFVASVPGVVLAGCSEASANSVIGMRVLPVDQDFSGWADERIVAALYERRVRRFRRASEQLVREQRVLLRQVVKRGISVDASVLRGWVEQEPTAEGALAAAAVSTDPAIVPMLRELLDDPLRQVSAARALAWQGDTASAQPIVQLVLEATDGRGHGFLLVALDVLGDRSVAPVLKEYLTEMPDSSVFLAVRTLRRLTGHSPLVAPAEGETWVAAARRAWAAADISTPPVADVSFTPRGGHVHAAVTNGREVFALEQFDPGPTSSWPLWDVVWTEGGASLYQVGSQCGTCELFLARQGWAPHEATMLAQTVRDAVADVSALTPGLLAALGPVLEGFATGRYRLILDNRHLTATTAWSDTWFVARDPDAWADADAGNDIDGHLFTSRNTDGTIAAVTVAPTQPASAISTDRVAHFAGEIRAGRRPLVIVAAHAAQRDVMGNTDRLDQSVTGFVIDGHHKLAAYQQTNIPATILWICDLEPRLNPGTGNLESLFTSILSTQLESS